MTGIAEALVALLPAGLRQYQQTVPIVPDFPYVLISANVPEVLERSQVRRPILSVPRLRCTVVGLSIESVMIWAPKVLASLEGARIVADGWTTGSVESVPNGQWITEDKDVTLPESNTKPLYVVLDFLVTASRAPA